MVAWLSTMDETVTFEVGGTVFKTKRATLNTIEGSLLASLDKRKYVFYFDRDPTAFRHILYAHRYGRVHVPKDICPIQFLEEMMYYGIPKRLIAPCCWKFIYETENDVDTLKIFVDRNAKFAHFKNQVHPNESKPIGVDMFGSDGELNIIGEDKLPRGWQAKPTEKEECGACEHEPAHKVWLFLDEPASSPAAKLWCFFYTFVVIVSVTMDILWLDEAVRVPRYLSKLTEETHNASLVLREEVNEKVFLLLDTDPHVSLFVIDILCMTYFILETFVHFSTCPRKLTYFFNPYHLLKITLVITMIISTIFEVRKDLYRDSLVLEQFYFFCKTMNVLRLLLIFRLYKIYDGLNILLLALRYSVKELALLVLSLIIGVIIYGCLIFAAEIKTEMFATTQISMWWSLITMTTVGYGDFYPTSALGYTVGVVCAVNGVIVLALPIAAVAGTFNNLYSRHLDFHKHKDAVRKEERKNTIDDDTESCSTSSKSTMINKNDLKIKDLQ
ncbi:hypothetical protein ACF0H5_022445 [Mactra antiquata]